MIPSLNNKILPANWIYKKLKTKRKLEEFSQAKIYDKYIRSLDKSTLKFSTS